jgi:hypothetical protein
MPSARIATSTVAVPGFGCLVSRMTYQSPVADGIVQAVLPHFWTTVSTPLSIVTTSGVSSSSTSMAVVPVPDRRFGNT